MIENDQANDQPVDANEAVPADSVAQEPEAVDAGSEESADEAEAPEQAAAEEGNIGEDLLGKVAGILPEGALGKAASLLDRDGDGNPLDDIAGIAGKFLGR